MTTQEYAEIRNDYVMLMEKHDRTHTEEAKYIYYDTLIRYIELYMTAKQMGNKSPDSNFMVKDAREKMLSAKKAFLSLPKEDK